MVDSTDSFGAIAAVEFVLARRRFLKRIASSRSDFIRMHFGRRGGVITRDHQIAAQLLKHDCAAFDFPATRKATQSNLFGRGLNSVPAVCWARQSRFLRPLLTLRRDDPRKKVWLDCSRTYLDSILPGDIPAIYTTMEELVLSMVLEVPSDDVRFGQVREFVQASDRALDRVPFALAVRDVPGLAGWAAGRIRKTAGEAMELLHEWLAAGDGAAPGLLRDAMAAYEAAGADGPYDDFLHFKEEMLTVLLASYKNTSSLICFCLEHLALDTDLQDAVRQETRAMWPADDVEVNLLRSMPLLTATLIETLRLYPPNWIVMKTLVKDLAVGEHKFLGGWTVGIPTVLIQRDPASWRDADRFDPSRFSDGAVKALSNPAFLAFGRGPRGCPGSHMGLYQAALVVSLLLRQYEVVKNDRHPSRPALGYTLAPRKDLSLSCRLAG